MFNAAFEARYAIEGKLDCIPGRPSELDTFTMRPALERRRSGSSAATSSPVSSARCRPTE